MEEEDKKEFEIKRYWSTTLVAFFLGVAGLVFFLIYWLATGINGWVLDITAALIIPCFIMAIFFGLKTEKAGKKHIEYIYVISAIGIFVSLIFYGGQLFGLFPLPSQSGTLEKQAFYILFYDNNAL